MPVYDMSQEKEVVERSLFPEGLRFLKIEKVVEATSKAGNKQLIWTVEDVEEKTSDIIYTVAEQGKRWAMKNMLFACGIKIEDGEKYVFEFDELEGKLIAGMNKHVPNDRTDRQGNVVKENQNKFRSFRALTKEEKETHVIPF